jgi:hypothetical protein
MKIKRIYTEEKGAVLVAVIFVLLVMMTLLTSLLGMTATEAKIAYNDVYATQAFYLAEGGTQLAVNRLYEEPNFRGEMLEQPLAIEEGMITSISIEDNNGKVKVTSKAIVKGIKKNVAVDLEIKTNLGVFSNAITAFGEGVNASIGKESTVKNGPVVINGNLTLKKGVKIKKEDNAEVAVNGQLTVGKDCEINQVEFNESMVPEVNSSLPDIENPASNNKPETYIEDPLIFEEGGVYLVNGDVSLDNLSNVTIYSTGNINILQESQLDSVVLLAEGNIETSKEVTILDSSLYCDGYLTFGKENTLNSVELWSGEEIKLDREINISFSRLYCNGLTVDKENTLNNVAIVSFSDINLKKEVDINGAVYAEGDFTAKEELFLNGSLFAKNIILKKESTIIYDTNTIEPIIPSELSSTTVNFLDWSSS